MTFELYHFNRRNSEQVGLRITRFRITWLSN